MTPDGGDQAPRFRIAMIATIVIVGGGTAALLWWAIRAVM